MHKFIPAALALVLAAPAFAQEAGSDEAATWQGAYIGGSILHGRTEVMAVGGWADWIDETFPGKSHVLGNPDGSAAAVRAGFDWELGPLVLGIGAEYVLGSYEGPFVDQPDSSGELREHLTVFGRAGVDAGQWMPYVLAGYTRGQGEYLGAFTNPMVVRHLEDGVDGYAVGIGAEVRLHDNWSAFAEYQHSDFGNLETFDDNATLVLDQVKLGVNRRF